MGLERNTQRQKCIIMILVTVVCPILTLWTIFGIFVLIQELLSSLMWLTRIRLLQTKDGWVFLSPNF